MKFQPLRPAQVTFDEDGTPMAVDHGDVYHARAGALLQAQAVFLSGNGLNPDMGPTRWAHREAFTILETGFGLGHNFLATWRAWKADPNRPERLTFVSVEGRPVLLDDARQAHRIHEQTPAADLSAQLLSQWPPPSPDLHRAAFENGRVVLLVAHADVSVALRELRLQADALYLDGFSPSRNPQMWSPSVFKALGRLSTAEATAATWSSAKVVREGLKLAGFETRREPGFAGKRDATVAVRRPWPGDHSIQTRIWPVARPWQKGASRILIIGAGLAGAACAAALAERGIPSLVIDRDAGPARGASGNPAGLFHGVLHVEDGAHARWSRAASWMAAREYRGALLEGRASGAVDGLLRREDHLPAQAMRELAASKGLPPEYVQVMEAAPAAVRSSPQRSAENAWWRYAQGGWIDPAAWVRSALQHPLIEFKPNSEVGSITRASSGHGPAHWRVLDSHGEPLAEASHTVLCSSWDVLKTLPPELTQAWPLQRERGQITRVPASTPGLPHLQHPLSGSGYALTLPDGDLLCGATSDVGDDERAVRPVDHERNLRRLESLIGDEGLARPFAVPTLTGRVGWRFHANDRLPLVGPCPAWIHDQADPEETREAAAATRLRDHPIEPGLFLATALGSRGVTWAPLIGQVIAAWITGEPAPVPGHLLDAVDPRRFALRKARRPPNG